VAAGIWPPVAALKGDLTELLAEPAVMTFEVHG
jgi:hypothetical protein